MLPRLSRPAVLAAICQFDIELRATEAWVGWEANRAHRWAIEHDGRLYPVKQIAAAGKVANAVDRLWTHHVKNAFVTVGIVHLSTETAARADYAHRVTYFVGNLGNIIKDTKPRIVGGNHQVAQIGRLPAQLGGRWIDQPFEHA